MPYRLLALTLIVLLAATPAFPATLGGPIPVPLPLFPQNNWWNVDISSAPLDVNSATFVNGNALGGPTRQMHPDFGGDNEDEPGEIYGIPFVIVDGNQPKVEVEFVEYGDQSDGEGVPFYPIPPEAITQGKWIEGGLPGNVAQPGDRHMLIVDKDNNHLYELYHLFHNGTNWQAGSGAFFDMNTNDRRPEGWTSADASGMAILPGLVRYDEVFSEEEIRHAFRVTVSATNGHIFPASHTAGSTAGRLPMGARLRLKASKNISGYAPEIQKIFRAMKKYGLIVADNGSNLYVQGAHDTRWNNDVLNPAFHSLTAADFEVIQLGWKPTFSPVLSLPANVGAGDATTATLTIYDQNFNVATGYTGTVTFTSTDGSATLPVNYTFTPGDAGVKTFPAGFTLRTAGSQIVTVTDVADATVTGTDAVLVGPATPASLTATATSTTNVNLTWAPAAGAAQYEISRMSAASGLTPIGTTAATNFSDTTALANQTYVYKVRALDASSRPSSYSAPDAATTILFTDDPLVAGATTVKATHLSELRTAVNAMRAAAALGAASFTDPIPNGAGVKAVHLTELRTAVAAARATLGLSALTFTDPIPNGGAVKAIHWTEIRNAVK